MRHDIPPWFIYELKTYRVYSLEYPNTIADCKSPSETTLESNTKSLPVVCRGAAYVTHSYGSDVYQVLETPALLWPGKYTVSLSQGGKYCCVVHKEGNSINLACRLITTPTTFKAGQTVLLLDGSISINGYVYSDITQLDLTEDKTFITTHAILAWTII
jgi:hypothetical protein